MSSHRAEWERRLAENPLAAGQVWDGNVEGAPCGPALFVILEVLEEEGMVRYEAPLGRRLDGYRSQGKMSIDDLRRLLWRLLSADEVERLGGNAGEGR